jgi:AcrR family transcriptional regulator
VAWILEGAAEVFAELGYAGATTNKIAARAGVSVGSLYQYFPNKDALVAALLEDHRADVRDVLAEAMIRLADPTVPLDLALQSLFDGLVDLHAKSPRLHRVLGEAARVRERDTSEEERYVREVERILRARPEVTVEDLSLAAVLVSRTVDPLTRWLSHEAPPGLPRPAFVDECVAMLTGYLTAPPTPQRA